MAKSYSKAYFKAYFITELDTLMILLCLAFLLPLFAVPHSQAKGTFSCQQILASNVQVPQAQPDQELDAGKVDQRKVDQGKEDQGKVVYKREEYPISIAILDHKKSSVSNLEWKGILRYLLHPFELIQDLTKIYISPSLLSVVKKKEVIQEAEQEAEKERREALISKIEKSKQELLDFQSAPPFPLTQSLQKMLNELLTDVGTKIHSLRADKEIVDLESWFDQFNKKIKKFNIVYEESTHFLTGSDLFLNSKKQTEQFRSRWRPKGGFIERLLNQEGPGSNIELLLIEMENFKDGNDLTSPQEMGLILGTLMKEVQDLQLKWKANVETPDSTNESKLHKSELQLINKWERFLWDFDQLYKDERGRSSFRRYPAKVVKFSEEYERRVILRKDIESILLQLKLESLVAGFNYKNVPSVILQFERKLESFVEASKEKLEEEVTSKELFFHKKNLENQKQLILREWESIREQLTPDE